MAKKVLRFFVILFLFTGCLHTSAECTYKRPKAADRVFYYDYYGRSYNVYLFYFGDNTGYASAFVYAMGQMIFHTEVSFNIVTVSDGWGIISNDVYKMGNLLPILYLVEDFDSGPWFCVGPDNQPIPMRVHHMDVQDALGTLRMPNNIFYCE